MANVPELLHAMQQKLTGLQRDLDAVSAILGSGTQVAEPEPVPLGRTVPEGPRPRKRTKLPVLWREAIKTAYADTKQKAMSFAEMADAITRRYGIAVTGREVGSQVYRLIRERQLRLEKVPDRPNTFALK